MHIEDSMKVVMKGHLGKGVMTSLLKNSPPLQKNSRTPHCHPP